MTTDLDPTNPLLADGLPRFGKILPEHAEEAVKQRLDAYQAVIDQITAKPDSVDYASVVEAETLADNALATAWSTIAHLHSVEQSPAWREAFPACLERLTRFHTERSQNHELYLAYKALRARPDFKLQSAAMKACIEHELTEFRLGGVELPAPERERFAEINLRLSALGNQFGNHVLDATEAYQEHFESEQQLAGLPQQELDLLASLASNDNKSGWMASLSYPSYKAIITYADDRALRERFHRAYVTRASELGPNAGEFDNTPIVTEMLALRDAQASLLGFDSHADMRLEKRMAESPAAIEAFLLQLADLARPEALGQLSELSAFAESLGATLPLAPWDLAYYSEKLREQQLGISQDKLKPWLEVDKVFDGLFGVARSLFALRFVADESVETWHEDARYYRIERDGQTIAGLFLDLYARPRKAGGAWMSVCRSKLQLNELDQQPVAYLTCNFAPPAKGQASLLAHDDVVTIFHEFGHCLHHLLSTVELPGVGGISGVEWDAVELPSQLMEGWAWAPESLDRFARHIETDEALPREWVTALRADRQFHGALALVRQVEFALCDLKLHTGTDGQDPISIQNAVHELVGVAPVLEENRFLMGFSHLFNGGYAAGYYSYLWAERLARDAFEWFSEQGLHERQAGEHLAREILSVGSTRPMGQSWHAFRGRDARLEPLLDAYGIAA